MLRKIINLFILSNFILSSMLPNGAYAQALTLPTPGTMLSTSEAYTPLIFKGLQVQPKNPMLFDFIIDTGDSGLKAGKDDIAIREESQKLIKYFLASLTLPEQDQWVNLSPYEQNRMMPAALEKTELGRDMLAQDYVLKQVTASLIYPEKDLGKQFWAKVYSQVHERFGNAEVPMGTFNKVWVVADKADVYVNHNTAFVVGSHLKVMLESDYLAAQNAETTTTTDSQEYTKQIVREIVLPALEKEVNTGKNFANLRQIFHAMILATWYKKNLKEALLNQVYSNKGKTNGVTLGSTNLDPQTIYSKYLEAYKKGAFNLIKEEVLANGETMPRKYFSGGEAPNLGADKALRVVGKDGIGDFAMKDVLSVRAGVQTAASDLAMLNIEALKANLGTVAYQRGDSMAFFSTSMQFAGSKGESPVGTLIASPESIIVDVRHLKNAQGNLTITDRGSNRREYRPTSDSPATSDSKLIRSMYLPFSEGMQNTLNAFPGSQALTWLDFSNNFGNPNYVSYSNGRLYYPTGYNMGKRFEQDFNTPLYSFVQYPDGKIDFEYVRYQITKSEKAEGYYDEVYANAFVGDRQLPEGVRIFSAIPLVANGQPADLPSAIRAGMFQDLRHLFVFPPAKHTGQGKGDYELDAVPEAIRAGIFFGLEELAANDYEKAAQALEHPVTLPMSLSISSEEKIWLSKDQVRGLLGSRGYVEETNSNNIETRQPEEGKFLFVSDTEIVIFLKANPYPHLLVGRTNDGNIFVQSIGGVSGRTGITIKEAFKYAQKLGLRDLMSVSQGTGSLIGYLPEGLPNETAALEQGYKVIVGASESRQAGSAVMNIVSRQKIDLAMTNSEFVSLQTEKLRTNFNENRIEWEKLKPEESREKILSSIHATEAVLNNLLEAVDRNAELRSQKERIIKAIELVFDKQGMKLRKDAKFYPIHPLQAALNFINNFGISDPDFILSAILHDSIEDVPEYKAKPALIGEMFGVKVQANVESVTNKELSPTAKTWLTDRIKEVMPADGSPDSRKSIDGVVTIIEYQLGVSREIISNPATLLLKSVDFSDNALKLKNLAGNPPLQARLASKYGNLIKIFAEEFLALAKAEAAKGEAGNTVLIAGLQQAASDYLAAFAEVVGSVENPGYSARWDYSRQLGAVQSMVEEQFGGLRGLKDQKELVDSAMKENPLGGIDMNAQKMQMNEKGQKIDMTFDPAVVEQFKRGDFTGLKPVIFNITPIANPSLLLGLNQEAGTQNS